MNIYINALNIYNSLLGKNYDSRKKIMNIIRENKNIPEKGEIKRRRLIYIFSINMFFLNNLFY